MTDPPNCQLKPKKNYNCLLCCDPGNIVLSSCQSVKFLNHNLPLKCAEWTLSCSCGRCVPDEQAAIVAFFFFFFFPVEWDFVLNSANLPPSNETLCRKTRVDFRGCMLKCTQLKSWPSRDESTAWSRKDCCSGWRTLVCLVCLSFFVCAADQKK